MLIGSGAISKPNLAFALRSRPRNDAASAWKADAALSAISNSYGVNMPLGVPKPVTLSQPVPVDCVGEPE